MSDTDASKMQATLFPKPKKDCKFCALYLEILDKWEKAYEEHYNQPHGALKL
jgi:hypothetical protein